MDGPTMAILSTKKKRKTSKVLVVRKLTESTSVLRFDRRDLKLCRTPTRFSAGTAT